MEKQDRRFLLKPLNRRRRNSDRLAIVEALERLDKLALERETLSEIRDIVQPDRGKRKPDRWKNPEYVRKFVALVKALYGARRISRQEYVFYISPIEGINDERCLAGGDERLNEIGEALDAVRKKHGLKDNEYWSLGEGPEEYERLNEQYSSFLEDNLILTLKEFGLNDLADLRSSDPKTYGRLRERGRRSVHHQGETVLALRDVVLRYEEDAQRAAAEGAYSAAITLLGAGVEGVLLLRCLRAKQKTLRVANALPKRLRPRSEDPTTWTFESLVETCLAAGWLPPLSTSVAHYFPADLAHLLREMRNYVHPGKLARERPWIEVDEDDFRYAEAIYVALLTSIDRRAPSVSDKGKNRV